MTGQPSTANFEVPVPDVEVAVVLKVGRQSPVEIGTLVMPSADPVSDLAGLLRAAADHMELSRGPRGGR